MKDTQTPNADLISRSALQKVFEAECVGECGCCKHVKHNPEGCALIDDAPAVDTIEVIRCKDCENFGCSPFSYSLSKGWCKLEGEPRKADYYCASGVKKKCG